MKYLSPFLAAVLLVFGINAASAQSWPDKQVKIIVAYPAGGGVDPVARLVGQKLSERWKQPVVIENKAGGSGTIGANFVAQAPADGLTILMSCNPCRSPTFCIGIECIKTVCKCC